MEILKTVIQSSELTGRGEKQDDDSLHNYTVATATMDCSFKLDSSYYRCHEIGNVVRVAFIAKRVAFIVPIIVVNQKYIYQY